MTLRAPELFAAFLAAAAHYHPRMSRSRRLRIRRFLFIGFITATLAVLVAAGLSVRYQDTLVRFVFLRRLCSDQAEERRLGIRYVARHAASDAALRATLEEKLRSTEDPKCFQAIVEGLSRAGVWGPDFGRGWVRYLANHADADAANERAEVAKALGRLGLEGRSTATDPRVVSTLRKLLADEREVVREAAVRATAAVPSDRRPDLLRKAATDASPAVSAPAWVHLGLLNDRVALPDPPAALADLPPSLARAVLFTRSEHDALGDWTAERADRLRMKAPSVAAFLPYAFRRSLPAWFPDWLRSVAAPDGKLQVTSPAGRLLWRSVLAGDPSGRPDHPAWWLFRHVDVPGVPSADSPTTGETFAVPPPVAAAAVHRVFGRADMDHASVLRDALAADGWQSDPEAAVKRLAMLTALPSESVELSLPDSLPPRLRLHAVRVSTAASPSDLLPALGAASDGKRDLAALRALACRIAVDRFDREACQSLALQAATAYEDEKEMAGALLAGLVGWEDHSRLRDYVRDRAEHAHAWLVRTHYRLARTMQNPSDSGGLDPADLLARSDVPRSTVHLALLAMGRERSLDTLFRPMEGSAANLRSFLADDRFWPLLRRYIPPLPPFGVWGDPLLQRFQVRVQRSWLRIHRGRLRFDADRAVFTSTTP